MARAVNGLPSRWTWIATSEIRVLPVPHSATTMAVRACCQRLASSMIAIACAKTALRNNPSIRGEADLEPDAGREIVRSIRLPNKLALMRM